MAKHSQKDLNAAHSDLDTCIRAMKKIAATAEEFGFDCCNNKMGESRDAWGECAGHLHDAIGSMMKARAAAGRAELPGEIKPQFGGK